MRAQTSLKHSRAILLLLTAPAVALANGPGSNASSTVIATRGVGPEEALPIPVSSIVQRVQLPDTGEIRLITNTGARYTVTPEALAAAEAAQTENNRHPHQHSDDEPCPNLEIAMPDVPAPSQLPPIEPEGMAEQAVAAAATAGQMTVPTRPIDLPQRLPASTAGVSSSPVTQLNQQAIPTVAAAARIADTARGQEVVDTAIVARQALQRQAEDDHRVLADAYRQLPNDHLANAMQRARDSLQQAADLLSSSNTANIERSEQTRFRNYFLNARDKAELGLDSLREQQQKQSVLGEVSPFAGLIRTPEANPLARTPELGELFGATMPQGAAATSTDALVNRLVMFNGLPPKERERMMRQLHLAESPRVQLPGGQAQTVAILHNGYILGGGNGSGSAGSALDCSSFVSSILPADVRKGRFTTLDFRMMWIYLRTGRFPNPPRYQNTREKLVKETATGFTAINIYEHEHLAPGDLLIYRLPDEPIGHVFLVRSYNASTLTTEVVEAAQSAGTVREREFPLSVYPMNAKKRFLRPGLMALRIKPVTTRACSYREHRRQASNQTGGGPAHRDGSPDGTSGGAL